MLETPIDNGRVGDIKKYFLEGAFGTLLRL